MLVPLGRFLQSIFLGVLALFKRALCFLNRKRRDSGSILPTHIRNTTLDIPTQILSNDFEIPSLSPGANDVNMAGGDQVGEITTDEEPTFTDWDNWEKPASSRQTAELMQQQQIAAAGHSTRRPSQEQEPGPEPDYFSDLGLAPTIRKQKKVLVKPVIGSFQHERQNNRLAFAPDLAAPISTELEEWDESADAWEGEDLTFETEEAVRESRKFERARRLAEHQKRNKDKEQRKSSTDNIRLATKLT